MTTPIVTEMPLQLEPATADSFLEAGTDRAAPVIRELDHRRSDEIDVRLLWSQAGDQIVVSVSDAKTGEKFAIAVDPHEALTAFHHPYSYATSKGRVHHTLAV
ncbi:MAG: hypothetical protein ACXVSF_18565 [Solirubrobacteraceae bacterium]